jgi:hypothetical protein
MTRKNKIAALQILLILSAFEIGGLVFVIKMQSMLLFICWGLMHFPVLWVCLKLALLSEEKEVKND